MSNLNLYLIEKDKIRENLNKYTKKAFKLIPKYKNPHILDIGCGSGVPTIELAKISKGHVIGLDINEKSLDLLQIKINKLGLKNQVNIIKDSLSTMDFPKEFFNIIWAEGSVFVIGFENSLKNWRQFLKPKGFLVFHDQNKDKNKKLKLIKKYNYNLIAQFELSYHTWWLEYYTPLEDLIKKFNYRYPYDSKLNEYLNKDKIEIEKCKSDPTNASSFFVIMKKM